MELFDQILTALLTAMVLQNVLLGRGLGLGKSTLFLSSPRKILLFGSTLTFIATVSTLISYPFYQMVQRADQGGGRMHPRYLLLLGAACLVYTALWLLTRRFFPVLHYHLRGLLGYTAFNCAVLGSMLIAFSYGYNLPAVMPGYRLLSTFAFVVGSGAGYTLALLLIYEGRRRLSLCDVPRSFRGLPVTLLYIGMLSLAIYGLIGHQLPT